MKEEGDQTTLSTNSLFVEIITVLDSHGIHQETYTLHDYMDCEALEELFASADANLEVRITIEGVQLAITQDGVQVLNQPSNGRTSSSKR